MSIEKSCITGYLKDSSSIVGQSGFQCISDSDFCISSSLVEVLTISSTFWICFFYGTVPGYVAICSMSGWFSGKSCRVALQENVHST
jgi:hypothetical protein